MPVGLHDCHRKTERVGWVCMDVHIDKWAGGHVFKWLDSQAG